MYQKICEGCEVCGRYVLAPQRSRVYGMRAVIVGDIWLMRHVEISIVNEVGKSVHLFIVLVTPSPVMCSC